MINNNIIVLGIGGGGANIVNYLSTKINDVDIRLDSKYIPNAKLVEYLKPYSNLQIRKLTGISKNPVQD